MKQIDRKRALELAMECIQCEMKDAYNDIMLVNAMLYRDEKFLQKRTEHYAELAAALAYIENLARQKELL